MIERKNDEPSQRISFVNGLCLWGGGGGLFSENKARKRMRGRGPAKREENLVSS